MAEKSNFRMALRFSINDVEAIILNILKLLFIPIALEKSLNAGFGVAVEAVRLK